MHKTTVRNHRQQLYCSTNINTWTSQAQILCHGFLTKAKVLYILVHKSKNVAQIFALNVGGRLIGGS